MERTLIAVVGSANVDRLVRVDALPGPGETVLGSEPVLAPGGKGANQAAAAALLGAAVSLVASLGADDDAAVINESMARTGVDMEHVMTVRRATGTAMILVDDRSENLIVVSRGANDMLDADRVDKTIRALHPGVVGLSLEIPIEAVTAAARAARAMQALVVLNLSPITPAHHELARSVDVVVVNEHEARQMFSVTSDSSPEESLERVAAAGCPCAVVTLGERGALVIDTARGRVSPVAPFTVTPVDTTGCGDAFLGALMSQLTEGHDIVAACAYANVVAALASTAAGAQPSYPNRAQVASALAAR